jgi:predicted nucleic-acid-binding Zn-ribbon protein
MLSGMLQQHVCPKCRHNHVLAIDAVPDTTDSVHPNRLHVAIVPNPVTGFFQPGIVSAGRLQAAVCRKCGYTELYTLQPELIPVDGKWVRELVGPESAGPYR